MRTALIALPLCLSGITSAPIATAGETQADDLSRLSIDELHDLVEEKKNWVDKDVFQELGARGTQESLEALSSCTKIVTSNPLSCKDCIDNKKHRGRPGPGCRASRCPGHLQDNEERSPPDAGDDADFERSGGDSRPVEL